MSTNKCWGEESDYAQEYAYAFTQQQCLLRDVRASKPRNTTLSTDKKDAHCLSQTQYLQKINHEP